MPPLGSGWSEAHAFKLPAPAGSTATTLMSTACACATPVPLNAGMPHPPLVPPCPVKLAVEPTTLKFRVSPAAKGPAPPEDGRVSNKTHGVNDTNTWVVGTTTAPAGTVTARLTSRANTATSVTLRRMTQPSGSGQSDQRASRAGAPH